MRAFNAMAVMCGVAVLAAMPVRADEITVNGNPYKNVLVTKTASFYYIQFPDEGRTVSVPIAEAESVKINTDPFYRSPLRETYTANRAKRAAGGMKDVDPAFKARKGEKLETAEAGSGKVVKGGGGAGGGGGGFGTPRTAVEGTLAGFGFQFQPGPGNTSSKSSRPDGSSLELLGPPDKLTGIVVRASGPAQAVDAGAGQLKLLVMQLKPTAVPAWDKAVSDAKANGSGNASADGVSISINRKVNGENVDIEARITAS